MTSPIRKLVVLIKQCLILFLFIICNLIYNFFDRANSSMIVEVIGTNFRLLFFFLQENFTRIKSIKNIYKRISDFLEHKTLNKQLSLRCFL